MKNLIAFLLVSIGFLLASCGTPTPPPSSDGPTKVAIEQPVYQVSAPVIAAADYEYNAQVYFVQDTEDPPTKSDKTLIAILLENWVAILAGVLGVIELIVRLTPTEKDNSIFNLLMSILNAVIPNMKSSGGKFTTTTE